MKTFTLKQVSYHRQCAEVDKLCVYPEEFAFYANGQEVARCSFTYLTSVKVYDNKIINSYGDNVINEFTFNSELKRKNKFVLDGTSFLYKNTLYICLDNEDYEVKEVLHYDQPTYTSYSTVVKINDTFIWTAITRSENKYDEKQKETIEIFFYANNIVRNIQDIRAEYLLLLSDEKKAELIALLQNK